MVFGKEKDEGKKIMVTLKIEVRFFKPGLSRFQLKIDLVIMINLKIFFIKFFLIHSNMKSLSGQTNPQSESLTCFHTV